MAHFYASIEGNRGPATRCGSKDGIEGHIRGWNVGVKVVMTHKNGKDIAYVYKTGGSSNSSSILLMALTEEGNL